MDETDYEQVAPFVWAVNTKGYATTKRGGRHVTMHVMLLGKQRRRVLDHIDRDRCNNRRSNLRFVPDGHNRMNSKVNSNSTTGLKGVSRHGASWKAQITVAGKRLYLGLFPTPEAAAQAYDDKAREHFGASACTNF